MPEVFGIAVGAIIVILIRLLVPLSIFRWPLAGGLAAGIVDTFDVVLIGILNLGDFRFYAQTDKALDLYFLLFMVIVALRWKPLEKWTAISLFSYRTIGVILFEITQIRPLLLIFPNLFLYFYYFVAARNRFFPKFIITRKRLIIALLILLIPKLIQEYILHYLQLQPWNWFRVRFL